MRNEGANIDIMATPKSPEINDRRRYEQYRKLVPELIAYVEKQIQQDEFRYPGGKKMDDFIKDGIQFQVRLPKHRGGKHGWVGIVEASGRDGNSFSFVIKQSKDDIADYLDNVNANPTIAEYVPTLYDVQGRWAVMEKIDGLELKDLENQYAQDENFRKRYAKETTAAILSMARSGVSSNDIMFSNGHNCMVDPQTAKIKIVELGTLQPVSEEYGTADEIVAEQLFKEARPWDGTDSLPSRQYYFELLREISKQVPLQNLCKRPRQIKSTHRDYEKVAGYVDLDMDTAVRYSDGRKPVLWTGIRHETKGFSPDLIAAVQNDDFEAFSRLIAGRKAVIDLVEKSNPMSEPVVLE